MPILRIPLTGGRPTPVGPDEFLTPRPTADSAPKVRKTRFASFLPLIAKMTKLLKFAKIFMLMISFLSAMCFAGSITLYMGVWVAVGVTALIFVHELGHTQSIARLGFGLRWPLFIPLLGAVIAAPPSMTRKEEATMALAGPVWGTIACFVPLLAAFAWISPEHVTLLHNLISIAMIGLLINTFNMIPMTPLDGGRVLRASHEYCKFIGLLVLVLLTIVDGTDMVMPLIWAIVISDLHFIPRRLRAVILGALALLYILLLGYFIGHAINNVIHPLIPPAHHAQSTGVYLIFSLFAFIGAAFCSGATISAYSKKRQEDLSEQTLRPYDPPATRIAWFALWAFLAVTQCVSFVALAHIQGHAEDEAPIVNS